MKTLKDLQIAKSELEEAIYLHLLQLEPKISYFAKEYGVTVGSLKVLSNNTAVVGDPQNYFKFSCVEVRIDL